MRHLLLSLLLLPGLAASEIYRWTDAQGQVHFSEKPASGAERIEVRPQVVERDATTREHEENTQRFYDARRAEKAQAAEQQAKLQAERRQECRELRDKLSQLEHGGAFYRTDAEGERHYYSDAQVEQAKQQLRSRLSSHCG